MLLNIDNNQSLEPPQGLHIPVPFTSILLSKEDAAEFYLKLEEVRSLLPADEKHYLKKDRDLAELKNENTQLIGIKNEFGSLVAGAMVMMPVTRIIAQTYTDYPWYGMAKSTALLSGLWTDENYRGRGFALANIEKVVELARINGMSNVLTGVASKNQVAKAFAKANFDLLPETKERPAQDGQPAYDMNFYRKTFFIPDRRPQRNP